MLTVPNLTSYTILLGMPPSAGELSVYLSIFSTFSQILLGTSLPLDYITWFFKQVHMYTVYTIHSLWHSFPLQSASDFASGALEISSYFVGGALSFIAKRVHDIHLLWMSVFDSYNSAIAFFLLRLKKKKNVYKRLPKLNNKWWCINKKNYIY